MPLLFRLQFRQSSGHLSLVAFRALHLLLKALDAGRGFLGHRAETRLFFHCLRSLLVKQVGSIALDFHGRESLPHVVLQPSKLLLQMSGAFPVTEQRRLGLLVRRRQASFLGHEFGLAQSQLGQFGFHVRPLPMQAFKIVFQEPDFEGAGFFLQLPIVLGLLRLALQGPQLFFHFGNDVAHASQVLLRGFEFVQGFRLLLFEATDSRCFLDKRAAVLGRPGEDVIDIALFDHRMPLGAGPRFQKETADVFQPAGDFVDGIFAFPVTVQSPRDHELVVARQGLHHTGHGLKFLTRHVAEDQRNFRHPQWLTRFRPIEDDVFHTFATQRFGALLTQNP